MSKVVPGARPIPAITQQNQLLALQRIKETIDSLTGQLNALNRVVTHADLISLNLASAAPGGGGSSGLPTTPGNPSFPGGDDDYDPTTDQTTPPPPAGVEVAAALRTAIVSWEAPPALYRNPAYAEVWVGTSDDRGAATLAGTSTSNFFTFPVTLGIQVWVWVRYVSQANVTGPDHDPLGTSTTPGKIGNADLGPLVVQAENLAKDAVDLSSDAVTFEGTIQDPARFGAMAVGYAVTRYLLAVDGVMENLIVDNAQIGSLSAAKLTAGDGTVGGILKSANWVAGANGWYLRPTDGYLEAHNIVARGTIYASAGSIGGFTITSTDIRSADYVPGSRGIRLIGPSGYAEIGDLWARGALSGGAMTTYAWPAAGSGPGFYLGYNGLLLGNFNDGQWVEIGADGHVSMPGLTINGGNLTARGNIEATSLSASVVVDTPKIEGGAVNSFTVTDMPALPYAGRSFTPGVQENVFTSYVGRLVTDPRGSGRAMLWISPDTPSGRADWAGLQRTGAVYTKGNSTYIVGYTLDGEGNPTVPVYQTLINIARLRCVINGVHFTLKEWTTGYGLLCMPPPIIWYIDLGAGITADFYFDVGCRAVDGVVQGGTQFETEIIASKVMFMEFKNA